MYLFPFVLVIAILFTMLLKSSQQKASDSLEAFWEREIQANSTPAKDITNLNYITISTDLLPFISNPSENIAYYEKTILDLSTKKILNLSGISNTDLKLQYGAANFKKLSMYDENFTILQRTLTKWSDELIRENYPKEALAVIEFAFSTGCNTRLLYENYDKLKAHTYK